MRAAMSKPTLKVTSDFTTKFNAIVKKFRNDEVLVGIPEEDNDRKTDEDEGPIGNAALLAINNFGSPMNNIPARPVMTIGIRNAQKDIAAQFKLAVQSVLSKGFEALDVYYERAGLIASNSIKKAINSQEGIAEPAEATLAARRARGFKGTKALIVTGQMRNAITYVLRGG
jgi:hypothetical protein